MIIQSFILTEEKKQINNKNLGKVMFESQAFK